MHENHFDEQLFAELYDVQPQAIFWMRPIWDHHNDRIVDFKFAYINNEALQYLNLTRDQIPELTLSTSPTLTKELHRRVFEEMTTVYHTNNKSETIVFNTVLNKHARVLRTRLRNGVLTVVQDITEEKRVIHQLEEQRLLMEEQSRRLQEQKTLLDNILKNSSNGISVSQVFRNDSGKVVDALTILANDAAVKYIGLPRDIYFSKRATEIEPGIIDSPYYQACIKTLETGEPFMMQYLMESTDRWLELTVSRLDRNHLIQVFTDVTAVKEAQLQLEKTIYDLKRSNTYLEDFAHAASHDVKEPLRKIRIFSQRLRDSLETRVTEAETKLMERINLAAERMQVLVDDLLEFSHVNVQADQKESIDLNEKIRKVQSDLELPIEENGAEIILEPLPTVYGNRRQLQQLFQNLLSNALKYKKPEVPPKIIIRSFTLKGAEASIALPAEKQDMKFHLIEVSDNGIGFDQKYAEQIFELFQRLHGRAQYSGSGVGLAIAKKVVENHNGYLWATSEPENGATFSVLLPA